MLFSHARADIRERAILNLDMKEERLLRALSECLRKFSGDRMGVLFSGGLDSSLLAALAKHHSELRLYTVGYPGSHDLDAGRRGAEELGLPWEPILLDDASLRKAVVFLRDRTGVHDPVTISFEVPLYIACAKLREDVLISGQGADELFGGYARYTQMSPTELDESMRADLLRLQSDGYPRETRLAQDLGKKLICPYLDPNVVDMALDFAPCELMGELGNKQPLRRIALGLGLSSAKAPKKAAQYGSGVMKAMKRLAASEGMDLARWIEEER